MSAAQRVYLPSTWTGLRGLVAADGIGPAPLLAHAVTERLRAAYPEGSEEEWEYAALAAAADSSFTLIAPGEPARRVVVAADVAAVTPVAGEDPTLVQVDEPVPFRRVACVMADVAEVAGPDTEEELAWFATQEIGALLDS